MAKRLTPPTKVNFFSMVRDIAVASINKGQFPVAIVGTCFIIMLFRMPAERLFDVLTEMLHLLGEYHILGWVLTVILTIGWFISSRRQRKHFHSEMDRLTEERNHWQTKQLGGGKVQSSN